jgi:hypothetical protein
MGHRVRLPYPFSSSLIQSGNAWTSAKVSAQTGIPGGDNENDFILTLAGLAIGFALPALAQE